MVWARTPDGIRGFLVENDRAGFSTVEHKGKYSLRASVTSQLVFEDCRIPAENLLPGAVVTFQIESPGGFYWLAVRTASDADNPADDSRADRGVVPLWLDGDPGSDGFVVLPSAGISSYSLLRLGQPLSTESIWRECLRLTQVNSPLFSSACLVWVDFGPMKNDLA